MSTGQNGVQGRDTLPTKIEYYVYDNPAVRTATISAYPGNASFRVAAFDGLGANEHVEKVIFYYDRVLPASSFEYEFNMKNSGTDKSGVQLPLEYDPAMIKTTLTAKQIKQADLPEAETTNYSDTQTKQYTLVRFEKEDSLFFGARSGATAQVVNLYGAAEPDRWMFGNTQFTFRRTTLEMKNYDDVKVYINPKTPADLKGMSVFNGLYVRRNFGDLKVSSKSDVYYKTNLRNTDWVKAVYETVDGEYGYNPFDLAAGEFVQEIMVDIGTIYGDKVNFGLQSGSDNSTLGVIGSSTNPNAERSNINFWFSSNKGFRDYYPGTPQAEPIVEGVKHYFTARAEVGGSTARHINPADQEADKFFNNTGTVSVEYKTKSVTNLTRGTTLNGLTYSVQNGAGQWVGGDPYQGSHIRYSFNNSVSDLVSYTESPFQYKSRYYFEIYDYVEVYQLSAQGEVLTPIETIPIPANETILYVFERTQPTYASGALVLYAKVRSDAAVNVTMPVFKASGTALVDFREDYMQTIGGVPYDQRSPYFTYNIQERPLPAYWGITAPNILQFSTTGAHSIKVQIHTEDTIDLQMYVDGTLKGIVGDFKAHQKEKLTVSAAMGNVRNAAIPKYEAVFNLPRAGGTTPTLPDQGVPQTEDNDFNLFLKGPLPDYPLQAYAVTYYEDYERTIPITITAGSSQTELEKVKAIHVYFENFAAKSTVVMDIPLRTDAEKKGADVSEILSYVGAESRKDGVGTFSVHEARPFSFGNYTISLRIGIDPNEQGRLNSLVAGIAKVTAYYNDGASEVQLYESSAGNTHNFQVNDDVEKITVEALDSTRYRLTNQNVVGQPETNDSDYPPDTGVLTIDKSALYAGTVNLYDASFAYVSKLTVAPIAVMTNATQNYSPIVIHVATNGRPAPLASYVKELTFDPPTQDFATVTPTWNAQGVLTMKVDGLKRGTFNYTYKITNLLGHEYSGTSTITVSPNYVPAATLKKEMDATTSSKLLSAGDTFGFELWEEDDQGNKVYVSNVTGVDLAGKPLVNDGDSAKVLTRGGTHFIKENAKVGYEAVKFTMSVDGAAAVDIAKNGDGDFEFIVPVGANNVVLSAVNKNSAIDLTVKKQITAGSLIKDPAQKFSIKITDQLNNVVYNGQLAKDETANVPGMIYGREYTVVETPVAGFEVDSMAVEKAGANVGNQPNSGNSYKFELSIPQTGATIVVKNKYPTGNGITLRKALNNYGLNGEDFTFVLTNTDNTVTYYGKVASTVSTHPTAAVVKWYTNATHTSEVLGGLTTLPVDTYTVEETSANKDFSFKNFNVTAGTGTPVSAGKKLQFVVTKTSASVIADVNNQVKTTGRVEINKTFDHNDFRDTFTFNLKHISTGTVYVATGAYNGTNYDPVKGLVLDKWTTGGSPANVNGSLPLGKYELTELNSVHYNLDGFTSTKPIQNDPILGNKKVTFTLTTQTQATGNEIVVAAKNNLKKGQLTLTKAISTSLGGNVTKDFEFELYRWNAATGTATIVDANGAAAGNSVKITMNAGNLTGQNLTLSGTYEYGKYFVVEKNDPADEFSLRPAPVSTVIAQGTAMTAANARTLETAALNFKAENRLNSAPLDFMVYKKVADTNLVGANTFRFELHNNDNNQLVFTGEVDSTTPGIGTSAAIKWTKVAGDGTVVAPSNIGIADLPYGNYTVKEVDTGIDFKPKDVSASGFGSKVSATEYKFRIDRTTGALLDFYVMFENQIREEATFDVTKTFVANENPFPGTMFEFRLYNTNNSHTFVGKTDGASRVSQWTDTVDNKTYNYNEMPYGTYELTEAASSNFVLNQFTVDASSNANITVAPGGGKLTIVTNSAGKITKTAAENAPKSDGVINLNKLFDRTVNPFRSSIIKVDIFGPEMNGIMPTAPRMTIDLNTANSWISATPSNLPYGKYKVVENLSTTPAYDFVSITDGTNTITSDDGTVKAMEVIIGQDTNQKRDYSMTVVNRVANKGIIELSKEIEGENSFSDLEYKFIVTDIYGTEHEVLLKAGEKKQLTKLPLGEATIREVTDQNFDWLGYEINGGARSTSNPVSIVMNVPNKVEKVASFSKIKSDGVITFDVKITDDLSTLIPPAEEFILEVLRSLDGGTTWKSVDPRLFSVNDIKLQNNQSHTLSGLLRGAQYKIVGKVNPRGSYTVNSIVLSTGTVGTVSIPEKSFTTQLIDDNVSNSVTFIYDVKRMDIVIDAYVDMFNLKVPGATFLLNYMKDGVVAASFKPVKIVTDGPGEAVFSGVTTGTYRVRESVVPNWVTAYQQDVSIEVFNNDQTGELEFRIVGTNEHISQSGNMLHIPHKLRIKDNKEYIGKKYPDVDSPLDKYYESIEDLPPEVDDEPSLILPSTGGEPLAYVAGAGILTTIIGIVLSRKKNKKD